MRACALLLLAGCSAPAPLVRPAAPTPPLPTVAPAGSPEPAITLDTSIETIWGVDPHAPLRDPDPEPAPAPEPERVAIAAPRARIAGRRAPCFAHRDVLVASEVFQDLVAYSLYMGADTKPPPKRRYGTCTVEAGKLTDARGTLIAEIHCGLTVHVRGVIDDLGFEVGASGKDIAAERVGEVMCFGYESSAECYVRRDESDEPAASYRIAVVVTTDDGVLTGKDARGALEANRIVSFTERMYCH